MDQEIEKLTNEIIRQIHMNTNFLNKMLETMDKMNNNMEKSLKLLEDIKNGL